MARYAKPRTGKFGLFADKYVENTTVMAVTIASTVMSFIVGIPMAIAVSPLFLFFFVPTMIMLFMVIIYLPVTAELNSASAAQYSAAKYKVLPRLRGSMEYDMALPIVEKIFQHTFDNHGRNYASSSCDSCTRRGLILRQLVPFKVEDESDIEYAKNWIIEKNKIMEGLS